MITKNFNYFLSKIKKMGFMDRTGKIQIAAQF